MSRHSVVGLGLAAIAGLAALGAPAQAQSTRYPPEPVDKDAEQAARSALWTAAITPERHPYEELVHRAEEALKQHLPDQTLAAIKLLDDAVRLLPREPAAYRLRGDAQLERRDWARCTADYTAAQAYTPRNDQAVRQSVEPRRKLGICQARAGQLSAAEKTLAEAAASGIATGEVWLRLGEVRVAMGKLDEAIAALHAAIEHTEHSMQAFTRFTLAAAYDRARRPADALFETGEGSSLDSALTVLLNPTLPPVAPGDLEYMLAVVYSSTARPEYALSYFRRFVKIAPDSPWRKRADDHIRELRTSDLPETVAAGASTTPLALDAARVAIRRLMPQMRGCLGNLPTVVVEVEVSKAGPRTPLGDPMRPHFELPPDGVSVKRSIGEISDAELVAVDRCLQPFATHLQLPAIKERDTYYRAMFYVVGP